MSNKEIMQDILEKIQQYSTILIHRHLNPDPDAIGSQVGLREILREKFPEKTILAVGYDEPTLSHLALMDEDSHFQPNANFLSIICDTANIPRIDNKAYENADCLIKIDHHPNDNAYGDLSFVEPQRSSTSEIITYFALEMGLTLTDSSAQLLYSGILGDTGRFLFSTSPDTFLIASHLAKYNFDRPALSRELSSFDEKVARLQGYVYENLEISKQGAARIILTQEILKKYGVQDSETHSIVNIAGNIRTVESWAVFVEQLDGHFRVRMRSKSIPINQIAKKHDGGGHIFASGANSYSAEENEQIWQEFNDNLK